MHRGMLALGIGAGDEVITVSNTDIACAVAIRRTGASIVFSDIDERTHNINPECVAGKITSRTKAILVVHMHGHPADLDPILAIAKKHSLYVIEDVALAAGARYKGRLLGTIGDVGCFSHTPSKILGNYGDGGTLVTGDPEIADIVRAMFIYWQMRDSWIQVGPSRIHTGFRLTNEGLHGRMVEWSAAVLRIKLTYLDRWIGERRRIAAAYSEGFRDLDIRTPSEDEDVFHVYRNYTVQVKNREGVRRRLAELGIETGLHYAPPLHLQPVYEPLGYRRGSLPVTEAVSERLFTLPIYPQLTKEQIEWVIESMHRALSDRP
jgi:dTDP-4-amino-4,6-dideoxygalactose transaminase